VLGQDAHFRTQDLTTIDLRHIIYRVTYMPYETNAMNTGIRGVRAYCLGELDRMPHKSHIVAVEVQGSFYLDHEPQLVPGKHHISFRERSPSNIAGMKATAMPLTDPLGIPCVARAVPAPISWLGTYVNGEATVMNHSGWLLGPHGRSPGSYGATGSFVVVSKDGQDLLPGQFEAMRAFLSEKVMNGKNKSAGGEAEAFAEWEKTRNQGAGEESTNTHLAPFAIKTCD